VLPADLRFYGLRHTCASLLIRQGASVKAVQKQLGYKSAAMTLDVYGHLCPDKTEQLARRMDKARAAAVSGRLRTQRGPDVIPLRGAAGR
jgi:integrase